MGRFLKPPVWHGCDLHVAVVFPSSFLQVPEAVQGWKVAKLPLRRDVRHLDDQVVLEFYDKLDAFLTSKRRTDLDY